MTSAHASADYEAPFQFLEPQFIKQGKPRIGRPGIAEIKPHTASGITGGARQVRGRPVSGKHERWLLTYLPVPIKSKKPRHVRVFAQQVTPIVQGPFELTGKPIPAMIPFPSTDQSALFGIFIEKLVQDAFRPYLPPDATVAPHTGGLRWGPDVDWKELASFYAELSGETADPFFEELTAELLNLDIGDVEAYLRASGEIEKQLKRNFRPDDVAGFLDRRNKLRQAFESVPKTFAQALLAQLWDKNDWLAKLFTYKLATPTRNEMIGILLKKTGTDI